MELNQYQLMRLRKTKYLNLGFRYQGNILKRTLSRQLYENSKIVEFLSHIETTINEMIFAVKSIKKNNNYCVDKDTDFIN